MKVTELATLILSLGLRMTPRPRYSFRKLDSSNMLPRTKPERSVLTRRSRLNPRIKSGAGFRTLDQVRGRLDSRP
jgi:hypothetical protein